MKLLIFSEKQPSWYIIFVKLVSSVSAASPDATRISVKMLSGQGTLFSAIPDLVWRQRGVNTYAVEFPLFAHN